MRRISLLLLFYRVFMETVLVSEVHAPGCRQVFCFLDRMAGLAARGRGALRRRTGRRGGAVESGVSLELFMLSLSPKAGRCHRSAVLQGVPLGPAPAPLGTPRPGLAGSFAASPFPVPPGSRRSPSPLIQHLSTKPKRTLPPPFSLFTVCL